MEIIGTPFGSGGDLGGVWCYSPNERNDARVVISRGLNGGRIEVSNEDGKRVVIK